MRKQCIFMSLIAVFVLCFSFGVFAHEQGYTTSAGEAEDTNTYTIDEQIRAGFTSADKQLWIGTTDAWQKAGGYIDHTKSVMVNGEAVNGDDIFITNGKVGIALAVKTRDPWGYPAGSILDAGVIANSAADVSDVKTIQPDRDSTFDIQPLINGWDAWSPNNCGTVAFDLVKYDFAAKEVNGPDAIDAVAVVLGYNVSGNTFDVVTYYSIAPDADFAYMYTYIKNTGGKDQRTTFHISATNKGDDGGAMFTNQVIQGAAGYTNTDKAEYFCGIMIPGTFKTSAGKDVTVGYYTGASGYKELVVAEARNYFYTFAADESLTCPCSVVIGDTSDWSALNEDYLTYMGLNDESGMTVVSGTAEKDSTIIVKQGNQIYGWFNSDSQGNFSFKVPQNDGMEYSCYIEKDGFCDGAAVAIDNAGPTCEGLVVEKGEAKVPVKVTVKDQNGDRISAKIEVFKGSADAEGNLTYASDYPTIRFNGNSIFYNDDKKGDIEFTVVPGAFKFAVYGYGYWYYSKAVEVKGDASAADFNGNYEITVNVDRKTEKNWYSVDMHHHINKNEAFSSPEDVIQSIAAAGLDIAMATDHDFTTNNESCFTYSQKYDTLYGFISSEEISCSWAHYNVVPYDITGWEYFYDENQDNNIIPSYANLGTFVDMTHEKHAYINANHPWQSYGLFYAYAGNSIPGGYTDEYDGIEINSCERDATNVDTMLSAMELWRSYLQKSAIYTDIDGGDVATEKAHYLVAGSDTHDVRYINWSAADYTNPRYGYYSSGKARLFAYAELEKGEKGGAYGEYEDNAITFGNAAQSGNSYVSFGPIVNIDPEKLPGGDEPGQAHFYDVNADGSFTVDVSYDSINGVKDIYVLTRYGEEDLNDGAFTQATYHGTYVKYDKAATEATRETVKYDEKTGLYSATVTVPASSGNNWVSFVVVDDIGCYAMTNPWWVSKFTDCDPNKWYGPAIDYCADKEIIKGYGDNIFKPDQSVTRAEFAVMMYRYLGSPVSGNEKVAFSDVKENSWYSDAVTYFSAEGVINGYPDGTFGPNRTITRAEIAQIVYKAFGLNKGVVKFKDVPSGAWYYDAVTALASAGVVNGVGDGLFEPNANATRAQSAQFIFKADRILGTDTESETKS